MVNGASGVAGRAFSVRLPAASGGTLPYTYSTEDLPAGLTFTASTRTISGTPSTATTTTVTYQVEDSANRRTSRTFTITISTPPPAAPTNLAATTGDGTITLTWTAAANALSYEVQQWDGTPGNAMWRTLPFGPFTIDGSTAQVTISSTTVQIGGLTNGKSYSHRVRSVNSAGDSGWTTAVVTDLPLARPNNLDVRPLPPPDSRARRAGAELERRR